MEQKKNEPTKENQAASDTGKPKKEREPLTEAQRLKRQKMIVLPAMMLVFIGAMWLIFAPSSGKEQPPGNEKFCCHLLRPGCANWLRLVALGSC